MDMDDDACYRAIETRDRRFDGRLFIAVTTTGIYCRPFCPAPTPKRENARFFPTAAAAQDAGFRPCLRCRPETSPDLAFWRGTSNTVSRALRLIEAGALDEADMETLAERLGIGERQLRRLFRQHLGASPVSIAQTRRILLAKQLIHDTRLPMTEVAAAAGFGSVRRFNETFRQLFRRPPKAIRRAGITAESAGISGAVTVKLGYRPPYDWEAILSFLRARAIPGIEAVSCGRYARTIAIGDARGLLTVEPAEGNCLRATVRSPDLRNLPAIIARARRVFDLARRRSFADDEVELEILHRRVEHFLDRGAETMDFVDEQHVALFEIGQKCGEIAGLGDHGAGGGAEANAEFARDDLRQRGLAETGGTDEQHMIERLAALARRLDEDRQIGARLRLADEFGQQLRAQRGVADIVGAALGCHDAGGRGHGEDSTCAA